MRKKIFLFLMCVITLSSCTAEPSAPKSQKILLLVSIPPYQPLVQQIAGIAFEVVTVVPPNTDPHTYEPTAKQLSTIAGGRIWFRIGEPFEQKLAPLLPNTTFIDLRQGLPIIDTSGHSGCCQHDSKDRHIWLSPKMVSSQTAAIAEVLGDQYPEQREIFRNRAHDLQEQLHALDHEIQTQLEKAAARAFLVSHPAFAYFCRDYQCQQLSIEQEGKEPRPKEIEQILKSAILAGVELAIAIPQHNNKGAELIADKLNIPVRFIDPYADDCLQTMRKLANLIANPYQTDDAP